jgi:hypothetical protein
VSFSWSSLSVVFYRDITPCTSTLSLCKVENEIIVNEEVKMIQPRKAVLRSVTVGTKKIY